MEFRLKPGEKIVWKCETDGKIWRIWPIIDDGNPGTDDELTDRTLEYRRSLGIRRVNHRTRRFDIERTSENAVDAWLKARNLNLTFVKIAEAGK